LKADVHVGRICDGPFPKARTRADSTEHKGRPLNDL